MTYKITLTGGFRSSLAQRRMARLWHPGTYTVPKDMPEVVATAALQAGMAVKEDHPPKPAPEPVAQPQPERVEGEADIPGVDAPEVAAAGEATFQQVQGGDAEIETSSDEEDADDEHDDKPKRGRPRRRAATRKRAAPANKSRSRAPSNKADVGDDSADVG